MILADEPTGDLDSQSGAEVVELMHRLNKELNTTFIVVTHDPAVARQTGRVLIMRDGKIVHEHKVGTPFEEDLIAFRRSGLGKAILEGDEKRLSWLSADEQMALQQLLAGLS
jgi:ABC-type dipeptide/oligopeptide/nickel transport system ATPase component